MEHRSPIENRPEAPRVGTFVKTGSAAQVEILGLAGLDFAILDAEHAPLDLPALDRMLLAGRATGLPCLVRLRGRDPAMAGAVPSDTARSAGPTSRQSMPGVAAIASSAASARASSTWHQTATAASARGGWVSGRAAP